MHLVNFTGEMRRLISKVIPLRDVRVTLAAEDEVKRIFTLLRPRTAAPQKDQGGWIQFAVPLLNDYEVIAVEK